MVYPYLTFGLRPVPRFPTPPARQVVMTNMPNDLIANGRNYYTEISFVDYRTGVLGSNLGGFLNQGLDAATGAGTAASSVVGGALVGGGIGALTGNIPGALAGGAVGALAGAAAATGGSALPAFLGAIRLPIPNTINDTTVLNWNVRSATEDLQSIIGGVGGMTAQNLMRAGSIAIGAVGAAAGKTLNPLLYAAFNRAEYRQFTFDWVLAPRTRKESQTLKDIVRLFKAASLPSGAGLIQDYPLLARIKMYPNDLDGLATFYPMAIYNVSINYTANPGGPSFFEDTGAPTLATLRVSLFEIKMRLREEVLLGNG